MVPGIQPSTTFPTPSSPLPPAQAPVVGQCSPQGLTRLTADHIEHDNSKGLSVPRKPQSLKYHHQHSMPSSSTMSSSLCRVPHMPQDYHSPAFQFPVPAPESWLGWLAQADTAPPRLPPTLREGSCLECPNPLSSVY